MNDKFRRAAWCHRRRPPRRRDDDNTIRLGLFQLEDRRVLDAAGLVADVLPGEAGSDPAEFTEFNGQLYFSARGHDAAGAEVGRELFQVDDSANVSLSADIRPGPNSSLPTELTPFGNRLFFAATAEGGRELFAIDTAGMVSQVADIQPGPASSVPAELTVFQDSLVFTATGPNGRELYRLDSQGDVQLVADIFPGETGGNANSSRPGGFTELAGELYFSAEDASGRELWVLDGNWQLSQVADLHPGPDDANPRELTVFGNSLYFGATDSEGGGLFQFAPGSQSPTRVPDVSTTDVPVQLFASQDALLFRAENLAGGSDLFLLDSGGDVEEVLTDTGQPLRAPGSFTAYNDTIYFAADVGLTRSLFRLQPGLGGKEAVEIPLPSDTFLTRGEPAELVEFPEMAGALYFRAFSPLGRELFRVNSEDQVEFVADINAGSARSDPAGLTVFENGLYFTASTNDHGRELHRFLLADSNVERVDDDIIFTDTRGGLDNRIVVVVDGDKLRITDENGHSITSSIPGLTGVGSNSVEIPFADLSGADRLVVNTRAGNDSLTLDLSTSPGTLLGLFSSFSFDGGPHRAEPRADILRIIGSASARASVTQDISLEGKGSVELHDLGTLKQLDYTRAEAIDLTGLAVAESASAVNGGAQLWQVADGVDALDGSADAILLTGSGNGLALTPIHAFANQQLQIDTAGTIAGDHRVNVNGGSGSHGNVDLNIDTGGAANAGEDFVDIDADIVLLGNLQITTSRFVAAASIDLGGQFQIESQGEATLLGGTRITARGSTTSRLETKSGITGNEPLTMASDTLIESPFGRIELRAGGDVFLSRVMSGAASSEAILVTSATGDVRSAGDRLQTQLVTTADQSGVHIEAGGSIGSDDSPIQVDVDRLSAAAPSGDIVLSERNDLFGLMLAAPNGVVKLDAGGDLLDEPGDTQIDISAEGAAITSASLGVAGDPLETSVSRLEATTENGSLFLANSADLQIGGVTDDLTGLITLGEIGLSVSGELRVTEQIRSQTGAIVVDAAGPLHVEASASASGPVALSATGIEIASDVRSGSGSVSIASGSFLQLDAASKVEVDGPDEKIRIVAEGSIEQQEGGLVQAANGDVSLDAGASLLLRDVRTAGRVDATAGDTIEGADGTAVQITSETLTLVAGNGIGASEQPVRIDVSRVEADTGGGVFLTMSGDAEIGGVSGSLGGVTATGDVRLATANGDLTVNESVSTEMGTLAINTTGELLVAADLSSDSGGIAIESGETVQFAAEVAATIATGRGTLSVSAASGVQMAPDSILRAAEGNLLVATSGPASLSSLTTAGNVELRTGELRDVNGASVNVAAAELAIDAERIGTATEPFDVDVERLSASSAGPIFLSSLGDVFVAELNTSSNIDLTADGNVQLGRVVSGGMTEIETSGQLSDDGDDQTGVAATRLTLRAGLGIGQLGDPNHAELEVDTDELRLNSETGFSVINLGGDLLLAAASASGDDAAGKIINLQGNLAVAEVALSGIGSVIDVRAVEGDLISADTNSTVSAPTVSLVAGGELGMAEAPIVIDATQVAAESGGSAFLRLERDASTIDRSASGGPAGIAAAAALSISSQAELTIAAPVTAASISLLVDSVQIDEAVASTTGDILITAGQDIIAAPGSIVSTVSGDAAFETLTGRLEFAGSISVDGSWTTFLLGAEGGVLSGSVSGETGVRKLGDGTLHITETSANDYRGPTELVSGSLRIDGTIGLSAPAGRLSLNSNTSLTGGGDVFASIFSAAGSAEIRPLGELTIGDGTSLGVEFAGVTIVETGNSLTLRDADNAEVGVLTRVDSGAVLRSVNGVALGDTETLTGSGFVAGRVLARSGAVIAPGSDIGVLTVQGLDLLPGSRLLIQINGISAGTEFDQLVSQTNPSIAGATLLISGSLALPPNGTELVILDNRGAGAVVGRFVDGQGRLLGEAATVGINGNASEITYVGGNTNDIALLFGSDPIIFVPPSDGSDRGEGSDAGRGAAFISGILLLPGRDEQSQREFDGAVVAVPEQVQVPPDQPIIEQQDDDAILRRIRKFRVYFKVVNDALQTEWPTEYDLPISQYDGNALSKALDFFRNANMPDGHYRVYVLQPGAVRPIVLADIYISGGKIVPSNYREEPGNEAIGPLPASESGVSDPGPQDLDDDNAGPLDARRMEQLAERVDAEFGKMRGGSAAAIAAAAVLSPERVFAALSQQAVVGRITAKLKRRSR